MASPPRSRARRKPTDGRLSDAQLVEQINAPPENATPSDGELVTTLSRQLGFLRNHFFALTQRYAANKVEAQQLSWEQGTELINGEMARVDAALSQIGGSAS